MASLVNSSQTASSATRPIGASNARIVSAPSSVSSVSSVPAPSSVSSVTAPSSVPGPSGVNETALATPGTNEVSAADSAAVVPVQASRAANAPGPRVRSVGKVAPRATWAEVNSALAANDTKRALLALKDLAKHGDAETRAKAELGIAQLSAARGDRASACASARTLAARRDVPRRVVERAQALLESCPR